MRVGIISVYMDYNRLGAKNHGVAQPGVGPLIAALLPGTVDVEVVNESWEDPNWTHDYDLLFISCMHPDFDRARQISHYWRRRGAKTVIGGIFASTYPRLCQPFFDSVVVGDAEGSVRRVFDDFCRGELKVQYVSRAYDATQLPSPRFDLQARRHIVPLALEATRGCPFSCEFCALTSIGTRFHSRPPEQVVRDLRAGLEMLRGRVPWWLLRLAAFTDNNIGGNPAYLKHLCEAMAPLKLKWGGAITFNALAEPGMIEQLAYAGCQLLFVGLESFNPAALSDMHKFQNSIERTRWLIDRCRSHGILLDAGLMLSATVDDWNYMRTIPQHLRDSGLHIPHFICFESPIPGTPYFNRLAAEPEPAFLPNAYLRDFNGYTLVVRPKRESVEQFVAGYRWVLHHTYTTAAKLRKWREDVPPLVAAGGWVTALIDVIYRLRWEAEPHPGRTYLAGTDIPPPEASSVPLVADDFSSDDQRRAIVEPWLVTDGAGKVLPMWQHSIKVFEPRGHISAAARQLVPDTVHEV